MYLQHYFGLVLLWKINEQIRCTASLGLPEDDKISAPDNLQYDNHASLLANDLDPESTSKPHRITIKTIDVSRTASPVYSPVHLEHVAAANPTTAESEGTTTINILFTVLLLATAILMVITGVCLMGLRRKYVDASALKYNQLKTAPTCNCGHQKIQSTNGSTDMQL